MQCYMDISSPDFVNQCLFLESLYVSFHNYTVLIFIYTDKKFQVHKLVSGGSGVPVVCNMIVNSHLAS